MMDITIINCLAYRNMSLMIIVSCNDISDITVTNQVPSDITFYPSDMSDMRFYPFRNRRITIEESRPRILDVRLKKKLPKEGEYYSEREVVTLRTDQWPTWAMATKLEGSEMYRADPKPPVDKIPEDKLA